MVVTKRIEFDMGHRIPNHKSVCKNLHGHRYIVEVSLEGKIQSSSGESDEGMVMDFGDIKRLLMEHVHEPCDHGFMYAKSDAVMVDFFKKNPSFKCIAVEFIPTAENIAQWIFDQLSPQFAKVYDRQLQLVAVQVWETPNSSAIISLSK